MDSELLRQQLRKSLKKSQRHVTTSENENDVVNEHLQNEDLLIHEEDSSFYNSNMASDVTNKRSSLIDDDLIIDEDDELGRIDSNNDVDAKSVMEAWSKDLLKSKEEAAEKSKIEVQYVQKLHMLSKFQSSNDDRSRGNSFILGVESREDLENLGKKYLHTKTQAAIWIENVLGRPIFDEEKSNVHTDSFYEKLKSGVLLCEIGNCLIPRSILTYNSEFDYSTPMTVPLLQRENISKFLRMVKDVMGMDESSLFTSNDLHNATNIPRVIFSLKAIAKFLETRSVSLVLQKEQIWPETPDSIVFEDDSLWEAQSEISKLDADAVRLIFFIDTLKNPVDDSMEPLETASFVEKKRILSNTLPIAPITTNDARMSPELRINLVGSPLSTGSVNQANSVEEWLHTMGLESYLNLFFEDGWDDLSVIATMTEQDLIDIGIPKRGHVRKLWKNICELASRLGKGKAPNALSKMIRETPEHEVYGQLKRWDQLRMRMHVTQELEDAKTIWHTFQEVSILLEKPGYLDHCPKPVKTSLSHMSKLVEEVTRSLVPFDCPVVLDIGWDTIKCGYLFNSKPICVPSVMGKVTPNDVQPGSLAKHSQRKLFGFEVVGLCDKASQANTEGPMGGETEFRKTFGQGIDSIKDPVVVEWDDLCGIIEYIFTDVLHTSPSRHPVFVVEPARGWGNVERDQLASLLVDRLHVPAFYFSPAAPLVAYQSSLSNCVVLDVGESRASATVVYNQRQMPKAVTHCPIGGVNLSELLMQELTREGLELKSVFEARKTDRYESVRCYLEHSLAQAIKNHVATLIPTATDICVDQDVLPDHLKHHLPRITRGATYLNVSKVTRNCLPEALFSPSLIRKDQFYKGGSVSDAVTQALHQCSEMIRDGASRTILLCGGGSRCSGIIQRLRADLESVFNEESRPHPKIMLATCEDSDDAMFAAWNGGRKLAMELEFQTKWVTAHMYQKDGKSALYDSEMLKGHGPLPLSSADTALYKSNRVVTALHDMVVSLHQFRGSSTPAGSPGNPSSLLLGISDQSAKDIQEPPMVITLPLRATSSTTASPASKSPPSSRNSAFVSPRGMRDLIQEVALYMFDRKCPSDVVTDVKMHLYESFAKKPPRLDAKPDEILRTLPERLLKKITKYIPNLEEPVSSLQSPGFMNIGTVDDDGEVWGIAI